VGEDHQPARVGRLSQIAVEHAVLDEDLHRRSGVTGCRCRAPSRAQDVSGAVLRGASPDL
jgi:hypothetical protein